MDVNGVDPPDPDEIFHSITNQLQTDEEDGRDIHQPILHHESELQSIDPDHIDIVGILSKSDSTENQPDSFAQSMQSINLTNSDTISLTQSAEKAKLSSEEEGSASAASLVDDISDIVTLPNITPAVEPQLITPTNYFDSSCNVSFTQQIVPDVSCVSEGDVSDPSTDSELWMPSLETKKLLADHHEGSLDPQYLTNARPNSMVPFVSPAIELVMKYHGEAAAHKLQAPLPPLSESNVRKLVQEGRLLSAVNMLTELLNTMEMDAKCIRLWTLRFSLLIKLKLYSTAEVEMGMFGNLDNCDLYYEFYGDEHRKGSIITWSFRLLWSILPLHCPTIGGMYGALDRMYSLVNHLDQALLAGLPYVQEQRVIGFKTTLLIQIAGALAGGGSIQPAIKLLKQIRVSQPDLNISVSNAIIRLYYQVGNIFKGEALLAEILDKLSEEEKAMNAGFKCIAYGEYNEAYQHFARAVNINSKNTVASINGAVCLLYLGKLGDSIIQFEGASKQSLHPMLLFNLVSLYELKTVASTSKKYNLLDNITNKSDWEGFPFECLRL